ncbi:hypothetical protein Tco_0904783 [Tanacetum coccineum]
MKKELNDTLITKERESATEASDGALSIVKEAIVSMKDTDSIGSTTAEVENHKADFEDGLLTKENESAARASDEPSSTKVPVSLKTEKIDSLSTEVENLKDNKKIRTVAKTLSGRGVWWNMGSTLDVCWVMALLESERDRADKFEKKFSEALETIEAMRVKMEETERRVLQLQESNRRQCLPRNMILQWKHLTKFVAVEKMCTFVEGNWKRLKDFTETVEKPQDAINEAMTCQELICNGDLTKVLLESETQRANECEKKYAEAMESINIMRQKLEEMKRRFELEDPTACQGKNIQWDASEESLLLSNKRHDSLVDAKKFESLSVEVENLKERQRANDCEKKVAEALRTRELKRQKLKKKLKEKKGYFNLGCPE